MAKNKFYAVRKGLVPGVYLTWPECEQNVKGFPGAVYKSFPTMPEAEAFVKGDGVPATKAPSGNSAAAPLPRPYAFVDGSYNQKTKVSGWGGFLVLADGTEIELSGSTDDPDMTEMRNVAGEIMGCMDAVQKAVDRGLSVLHVYYDYMGIECWATGAWKTNKPGTKAYAAFMKGAMKESGIAVEFHKVAAHTGIPGNERADRLAKAAVGIS